MVQGRVVVLAAALVLTPVASWALDNPFPDETVISPGIKLGYTFGENGGFTFGVELSFLFRTGRSLDAIVAHGPAFNFSWASRGIFIGRIGWEVVSWLIGFEAGPSLVAGRDGAHFSVGLTPWLGGIWVVPYYTYTLALGGTSVQEAGTYLKLPLCPGCEAHQHFNYDLDDD